MMASDTSRPPSGNGGSRPPTSRFVEGSMNDRVSAVPPPQFLGPDQMKEFEKQFYTDKSPPQSEKRKPRRRSPFSDRSAPEKTAQEHVITHRKSTGFFGRVRDALGWSSSRSSNGSVHKQDTIRKHSSLQEPMLPPPRPDHLRAAKSHSEMYNIPQLPNLGDGAGRPTREDVIESYKQLMATGFFQSHAIQSTRYAAPANHGNERRSVPPLPSIPGSAPCSPQKPPPRTSSIDATRGLTSPRSLPTETANRGQIIHKPESEDEFMPALNSKEISYPSVRGRKRNRADAEGAAPAEASGASTSSSFAQPLKRVAKKLRKMPSSPRQVEMADGVIRLPPSVSTGGTLYLKEKAVRMRSPSPAPPEMSRRAEQPRQQTPRRTFSGSSKGEGNRLRKRRKSASLRARSTSPSAAGFENWEMAGERMSIDSIRSDATATHEDGAVQPFLRAREVTPLSVVPDANRGIPSVPRIPDRYHFYHKPSAKVHRNSDIENKNAGAEWHFGEAL